MMKGFDTMKMKKLLACACLATASLVLPCRADDDYTCVTNGFSFNYSLNTDGKVVIHNNNGTHYHPIG